MPRLLTGRFLLAAALLAGLLCTACRKDAISEVEYAQEPVTLLASSVTLPVGGYADIVFRYEGASPSGRVSLRLRDGGTPGLFSLAGVSEGDAPGLYVAKIADNGIAGAYSAEACIVIDDISSAYLCVNCGEPDYPKIVDTGLPVLYIDTYECLPVDSRTVERQAVIKVKGDGGYPGIAPASCTVCGRGNTSWEWPKKPYKVEFRDRVSLLGMPAAKHWALLANFPDRTLMRNLVAMKVSSLTSLEWTPRCVPVELVLNGRHLGNYLLSELVEADENRVDVLPEGFLLELDFHYDAPLRWIDHHGTSLLVTGIPFAIRYPFPEQIDPGTEEAIKQYVADAADALYSEGFADPETGYARWLDVDSFVDYWLVFAVTGNPELANPGSVFFHKKASGKLVAGPCWDFDWCLTEYGTSVQQWSGLLNRNAIWYARLFRDPAFAGKVRQRFLELKPSLEAVAYDIDGWQTLIEASAVLNFAMWNPAQDRWQNKGLLLNGDENLPFAEAAARLRRVYLHRLQLLEENL